MLTPAEVHHGDTHRVLEQREQTLRGAWGRHPERFVLGVPKPQRLPDAIWINPPVMSTTGNTAQ